MSARKHRSITEATNAGHYFSDCSCGWSGGVYPSRHDARYAWNAHTTGQTVPENVKPTFLIGGPAQGMDL